MMRPRKLRRVVVASAAALVVTGVGVGHFAAPAPATTLVTDGVFMPPGSTAKAFNGAFCQQGCTAVRNPVVPWGVTAGAKKLAKAVEAGPSKVTVMGYSLGAAVIDEQLAEWSERTDPPQVRVVTLGNPNNPRDRDRDFTAVVPQTFDRLNVVAAYDVVADKPARWGFYSQINLSLAQHFSYFTMDVNDPDNLVYRDGSTTHMLVEPEVLPMLRWRDWFTSDERMAELDAKYRPLIEKDYDRPDFVRQGEGADWANDVEPESLREESSGKSASRSVSRAETSGQDTATTGDTNTAAGSKSRGRVKATRTTATTDAAADTNGHAGNGGEE